MLYLEELVDAVLSEEGQTLMGLEFLVETLDLPMKRIDLIFRKALSEYGERRPMKRTTVINEMTIDTSGEFGSIKMPEGTTSCRIARYGVMPGQMPRYMIPRFDEQQVEFDPVDLTCRVWPPITPVRLTYTQKYVPTTNVLLEGSISLPYETDEYFTTLNTQYAGDTLKFQQAVTRTDEETGEQYTEMLTMEPTGYVDESNDLGDSRAIAYLSGTMGTGQVDLKTREVTLTLDEPSRQPVIFSYYPKYSVVKELDIGHYVLTKMFACKFLQALASLRAQATQEKLHNIDLTSDDLLTRARELKQEVREICRSTISFGSMAIV